MKKISFVALLLFAFALTGMAQNLSGVKIYINPGHGGYDSDDRNVVIPPFTQGDRNGFWESKSNLDKGLYLKGMLDAIGATTFISRVTNTTADDLPLSQIVASANQANVDFMLSIHSNAGNTARSAVLMLYAGVSPGDTYVYPTATPYSEQSWLISTEIAKNLYSNQATSWSSGYSVQGDKTFARVAMGWSDGYGVLRGLTVPGVISEGSHHDYLPETYRLMNMEYKWLEAWHFLKSFAIYFKSATLPKGNIAGTVKDRFLLNDANYNKIPNTHDIYLPVNGATVTLLPKDTTYKVDNLNNGIYLFKNLDPGTYTLITKHPDYHSDTTTVVVEANKTTYANIRANKVRNTPPAVVDYSPKALTADTLMLASSVIRFRFNWDIDPVSAREAFSISPAVTGQFVFKESNYVMEFVPSAPLEPSTEYTVTLAKTLKHYDGFSMTDDFSFRFKTVARNALKLIAAYPMKDETNIDYLNPRFTFVFDKKLQTSELLAGVQVYDKAGVLLTKNGRSMLNNMVQEPYGSTSFTLVNNLVPNENYTVKIAKGIKDIDGVFLTDTIVIPFKASNERFTDKLIVDRFETTGSLQFDEIASTMVEASNVSTSGTVKLFDAASLNLSYNFTELSGGRAIFEVKEPIVELTSDSVIGLHLFGDMSGNEVYLRFASADNFKEIKLDSIHYGGWKYLELPLKALSPDIKYRFVGYKFLQREAPLSSKGNVYIDNMLVYSKIISSVSSAQVADVSIYPNPANDYIFVRKNSNLILKKIELYSLSGQLIRTSVNEFMNISDILTGTYIVRLKLNEGVVTRPIIIKR